MDQYQQYIHKSRYARYLDDKGRRENWGETVNRFMSNIVKPKIGYRVELMEEIRQAIFNQDIMPSMRAMMTAGEAARRDNTCIYNCSYLPVDSLRSFDEAMFILLCGTGVGFSVESKYVSKLPSVPSTIRPTNLTITVPDSKEGWAHTFRLLLQALWNGEIPTIDYSQVRPAGARLNTFGGRASGPDPLRELFKFAIDMVTSRTGQQLTTLDAHDLMCKVGEVVVVGGVRRSAMISLSDLNDPLVRGAKSGDWWVKHPYRALANNSAVYEKKPDIGTFMREWSSLHDSFSGERGIFNREASRKQAAKNGRRDADQEFGTNPCSEIILRPYQFCNLTEVVVRSSDTMGTLRRKVYLATVLGTIQSLYTDFPYLRDIWKENTEAERLLGVSLTGIYDNYHKVFYGDSLQELKRVAIAANQEFAAVFGIPRSTAITCVKPSGTVSQLTDSASGCHPRHAKYYYRRVRGDNKDPITQFMIAKGIPNEPDVMKPNHTTVFTFPQKAPNTAMVRDSIEATEHLYDWLKLQREWCEHKPSVTINLKDDDWLPIAVDVWEHFDEITGVSFLPHDGGSYQQAPYEECTEDDYLLAALEMPVIDFDELNEQTDVTVGQQTLACTAGACEI